MFKRAVERRLKYLTPSRIKRFPPLEKPQTPEIIKKLLTPIDNFEVASTETGSDISDAFEEFHKEYVLKKKGANKKTIRKTEADWLIVEKFSDLYKDVVKKIREELKISSNIMNEDHEEKFKARKKNSTVKEVPDDVKERIVRILADQEYLSVPLDKIIAAKPAEETEEINADDYDALSGIWRQLESECKDKKFVVTHPNFNAYQQGEPHWLEQPSLPFEIVEESIQKCKKWLSECENIEQE